MLKIGNSGEDNRSRIVPGREARHRDICLKCWVTEYKAAYDLCTILVIGEKRGLLSYQTAYKNAKLAYNIVNKTKIIHFFVIHPSLLRARFMRQLIFKRIGYCIALVTTVGLMWLSLGPAGPRELSEGALAASDPVIAAAGDIACDPTSSSFNSGNGTSKSCRQKYTADILTSMNPAAVLALGDIQYYCGGYQAFLQSYDLSWGRLKSITRPVVGNHEYKTDGGTDCTIANEGAAGYFQYFGSLAGDPAKGYYSYNVGTWHIIALNSNCSQVGGCSSSTPQGQWLKADLAAHSNYCTLAYWHIPLFSSGGRAASNTASIWRTLYQYDVDVVLNGHDHIYERFAPQTPDGVPDPARGIRQFIVGSGGANHTSIETIAANSEVRNTDTYGVLKLTLHPTSYDWEFVPEVGKTFTDSGTANCHGSSGSSSPTRTPTRTPTGVSIPTLPSTGNLFTFTPTADAYIYQNNTAMNYGSATTLQIDNNPVSNFLLKFDVSGLSGKTITRAHLRLYATNASAIGGKFYQASNNTWQEGTVTWDNAPAAGASPLGSLGRVSVGNWYEVDLTSLITGEGTYSLRVSSTSGDGAYFSSKEGNNAPQLVIETQAVLPTSTATSEPLATPTDAETPTATSTAGDIFTPTSVIETPTSTPTDVPDATVWSHTPLADSYVNVSKPGSNYGTLTTLRADASPDFRSYLRFDVQGLSGTVTKATLRVYANSASSVGCTVYSVDDHTWSETAINYNNAPALGNALGSSGSFGAGTWFNIDVTAYVTGNGTYDLALTTPSSTAISLASREAGANAPQLIMETVP